MRVIADRYELREALGHGGMARVYVAADRVLDRLVAVKLLRDDIGRDHVLRERFLREARLAGGLNHRSIVRVFDAGIDEDTPWIAMELVEGPSLREAMTRRGRYPADEAVELIAETLRALGAAHAAGVVHRDIKPANVLLSAEGPKLSDFGIAKSQQGGADLTQTNQFMGTPKYTAPEVAMGHPATPQADVYSAAVVLWEMLTGFPPYEHDNPLSLAMMHRTDPLPSLAAERPDLPTALVAAIEAGLAKEPPDRPVDAATFASMLAAGLAGTAMPPPSAATAPTAALPRMPASAAAVPMPQREQTMALPAAAVPRPSPGLGRSGPVPGRPAPRRNTLGIVLTVVALLLLAAFAFTQLDGVGAPAPSDAPTTVPTPTATPTATPTTEAPVAPTSAPAATDPPPTTDPEPDPTQAPPPQPTPTPEPTTEPAPEPTAPAPTPRPTATAPAPTEQQAAPGLEVEVDPPLGDG